MPTQDEDNFESDESPNEREIGRDAASPGGHQKRVARRAGKPSSVNAKTGLGFFPEGTVLPREAELVWPEILSTLEEKGMTPYDVSIQVVQLDPPTANGSIMLVGAPINGGAVQGNTEEPAGAALVRYVTTYYHLPRAAAKSAVKYQLRFSAGNKQIARAELTLGPAIEIQALDRADRQRRAAEGAPPPPAFVMPPPVMPPTQQPMPMAGVGAPPASTSMADVFMMAREMSSMAQQGQQMPPFMTAFLERAMAGMGAPPAAAPASPPIDEAAMAERVTANVVTTLAKLGVITIPSPHATTTQQPGVAAPPAAAVPKSAMERAFERVMDAAVTQFVGGVEKSIKATITGVGAPPPDETPIDADEDTTPQEKPPTLPWKAMPVPGANWGNGAPVHYAEDSETGGISLQGFVMNNPVILEKGFEVATGLAGAATDLLKRIGGPKPQQKQAAPPQMPGAPAAPQIVSDIPAAAADGTPKQDGWK